MVSTISLNNNGYISLTSEVNIMIGKYNTDIDKKHFFERAEINQSELACK